jgi:hypothetical protein
MSDERADPELPLTLRFLKSANDADLREWQRAAELAKLYGSDVDPGAPIN